MNINHVLNNNGKSSSFRIRFTTEIKATKTRCPGKQAEVINKEFLKRSTPRRLPLDSLQCKPFTIAVANLRRIATSILTIIKFK